MWDTVWKMGNADARERGGGGEEYKYTCAGMNRPVSHRKIAEEWKRINELSRGTTDVFPPSSIAFDCLFRRKKGLIGSSTGRQINRWKTEKVIVIFYYLLKEIRYNYKTDLIIASLSKIIGLDSSNIFLIFFPPARNFVQFLFYVFSDLILITIFS